MQLVALLALLGSCLAIHAYIPLKENGLSEAFLRQVVDKMRVDLDSYLEDVDPGSLSYPQLMSRSFKDSDYQDSPSVRDHEYLEHGPLWANAYLKSQDEENFGKPLKQHGQNGKSENLPAYCNPPNPCPYGYTSEKGCLEDFENTAAFSRDYQAQQDCMCDTEHMFDCSASSHMSNDMESSDLDRLVQQFHVDDEHKSLVAKKFHVKKAANPFLLGEKLPVAAKKGINVISF